PCSGTAAGGASTATDGRPDPNHRSPGRPGLKGPLLESQDGGAARGGLGAVAPALRARAASLPATSSQRRADGRTLMIWVWILVVIGAIAAGIIGLALAMRPKVTPSPGSAGQGRRLSNGWAATGAILCA